MSYISRHIGTDRFEVFDEATGRTEKLLDSQLRTSFQYMDLSHSKIPNGIVYNSDGVLKNILPYQPSVSVNTLQVKTKMLEGIDVRVYRDRVSAIIWDADVVTHPVSLRLSDFCRGCWDCILTDNVCLSGKLVTLILDDKLEFISMYAFQMDEYGWSIQVSGIASLGVVFDLRELTNETVATAVYHQLISGYNGVPFDSIIDNPDRMQRMKDESIAFYTA